MLTHYMGVLKMARISKQNSEIDYKELYGKTLDEVDLDAILSRDKVKVADTTVDLKEIDKEIEEKKLEDFEKKKKEEKNKRKSMEDSIKDFQRGKETKNQKGLEIMGLVVFIVIWLIAQLIMLIIKFNTDMSWGISLIPTMIVAGIYLITLMIDIITMIINKVRGKGDKKK